ncbi:MAG: HNH endonuclease [Chloroflexi bacterium]|nr:HNH endonuclease [Chloroflexota bacterium]MYC00852.1 HNH endonuclease [Chloroflexota bacterium]
MPAGQPWTRRELLLALGLYLDPLLGSQDKSNDRIIDLAKRIGRSPDSVVFKMANFKNLDPTAVGGFSNVGARDRELWDDVLNRPRQIHEAVSEAWANEEPLVDGPSHEMIGINTEGPQLTEAMSTTKSRRGQDLFRRAVLNAYQNRCCVTGVGDTRLLVASHIKPWRDDKENRLNPTNGLCLNVLHDKAFDIGLITVGEDYRIKVSSILKNNDEDFLNLNLVSYEGVSIGLPQTHQPSQEFLAHHRQHIFTP